MEESNRDSARSRRVANTEKTADSGYRVLVLIVIGLIVTSLAGFYIYFNLQQDETTISVGSGPYRSDSYELMQQIADVVERNSDWLRLDVVPTHDSSQNISFLNEKKIDAATIRSDTPVAKDVRLVASLFPDFFQILTRADRPIFQVRNLIGRKVAIPRFGTDEFRSFWIIGDHYDLPINAVKWEAMEFTLATKKLLSGEVDAIFTVRSLRDRLLLNLIEDAELKREAIRFLPIHQAEAIALKRPFLNTGIVPAGAFLGKGPTPIADARTVTVDRMLVTREELDPEIIRELTRILFEHRLDLTIRFALASAIRKPDPDLGFGVPLHEGSHQYYSRDEPSFIQENAEPLALMVTVLAMLISSLIAMRSRWVSTQKDRMDTYNYALLDIAEAARNADCPNELETLKTELFAKLERVVVALDSDQVTDKGFQSFSLLWESVHDIVNDRAKLLEISSIKKPIVQDRK